jgi:predicted O-methyltransferase YrrM
MISVTPQELSIFAINGFGAMQKSAELTGLIGLIWELQPKIILEIGVGKGGTSWAWTRFTNTRVIAVDLVGGPWGGGPDEGSVNYIKESCNDRYTFINANSQDLTTIDKVEEALGDEKIDFLFIDGDHSYEGVKFDFDTYSQFVREGGLIAFHDICEHAKESGCDVKRFWDEVKVGRDWQEIIAEPTIWGGIGVLKV